MHSFENFNTFLSGDQFGIPEIEDTTSEPMKKKPPGKKPPFISAITTNGKPVSFITFTSHYTYTDQAPSLPELLQLKIPEHIGADYKTFGVILLNDKNGSKVNIIKKACHYDPKDIVITILEEWLTGKGKLCTWKILIETLKDCELNVLAEQMQAKI